MRQEPGAAGAEKIRAAAVRAAAQVNEIELLRSHEYALLAALLARPPSRDMLRRIAQLNGDNSPLGQAHRGLAAAAHAADPGAAEREYFDLFVGVGRGELMPYASYYQT